MFAICFPFPPEELQNKLLGLRTKSLKAVTPHLMPITGLRLTEKTSYWVTGFTKTAQLCKQSVPHCRLTSLTVLMEHIRIRHSKVKDPPATQRLVWPNLKVMHTFSVVGGSFNLAQPEKHGCGFIRQSRFLNFVSPLCELFSILWTWTML